MKIVIATPLYPPQIGGPATYAKTLENELPKEGVEVVVLPFSLTESYAKYIRHIVYGFQLFRVTYGADVILALDPVSVGLPAAIVAMIRGKKLVVKVVGDYAWEQGQQRFGVTANLDEFMRMSGNKLLAQVRILRLVQRFVAERARRIIVPSKYLKQIVASWGLPEEKISVIYNAFTVAALMGDRAQVRSELGVSGTVLLSAGRLVPWKGFPVLIAVVGKLREQFPDLKLFIAGGGPDEAALQKLIIDQNLASTVILLGNVEHTLLMKYIRATDCFVLNTGYEGLSHQLLEVLAVGTPIVTTRVGGNTELILDEVTGLLVSYNDVEGLTEALTKILNDKKYATEMAMTGKNFVTQFTVVRMKQETKQIFDDLLT